MSDVKPRPKEPTPPEKPVAKPPRAEEMIRDLSKTDPLRWLRR